LRVGTVDKYQIIHINLTTSFDGFALPANEVSPFKGTYYQPEESYTHIELEVFQDNNTNLNTTNQTDTNSSSLSNSSLDSNSSSNVSVSEEPQCLNEFCGKNDTENSVNSTNSTIDDSTDI